MFENDIELDNLRVSYKNVEKEKQAFVKDRDTIFKPFINLVKELTQDKENSLLEDEYRFDDMNHFYTTVLVLDSFIIAEDFRCIYIFKFPKNKLYRLLKTFTKFQNPIFKACRSSLNNTFTITTIDLTIDYTQVYEQLKLYAKEKYQQKLNNLEVENAFLQLCEFK